MSHPSFLCGQVQGTQYVRTLPLPGSAVAERVNHRQHLCVDRHRLHHGLWHHRHDQLRPRRGLHDRLLCRFHGDGGAHDDGHRQHLPAAGGRLPGQYRHHRHLWLDHRAGRLPPAAGRQPADPPHLRHRHVDLPAEHDADGPGLARHRHAHPDLRRLDPG